MLVDTSTDLRQQALLYSLGRIDAVLFTHAHADHVHGLDDLRSFVFVHKKHIPVYAKEPTASELELKFSYAFFEDPDYEGGAPPRLELRKIECDEAFSAAGQLVTPLEVMHGRQKILGFRVGNFAYITDCSQIPEKTLLKLESLDCLILDGLRFRPHPTHFTIEQATELAKQIGARSTYLTHLSHEVDYEAGNNFISEQADGKKIELAYDGLTLTL